MIKQVINAKLVFWDIIMILLNWNVSLIHKVYKGAQIIMRIISVFNVILVIIYNQMSVFR